MQSQSGPPMQFLHRFLPGPKGSSGGRSGKKTHMNDIEWYYECVDCGLCQKLWLFCISNSFSTVLDCGICVLWSWARSVGWSDFVELAIVKRAWKLSTGGLWKDCGLLDKSILYIDSLWNFLCNSVVALFSHQSENSTQEDIDFQKLSCGYLLRVLWFCKKIVLSALVGSGIPSCIKLSRSRCQRQRGELFSESFPGWFGCFSTQSTSCFPLSVPECKTSNSFTGAELGNHYIRSQENHLGVSWSQCTNVRIRFDFYVFAFISMSALSCYCNIVKTRVHLRGMIFLRAAKRADQKGGSLRPLRNAKECVQCAPAKYWSKYWLFSSIDFVFDQKTSQRCQQSTYSTAAFLFAVKKLLGANLARVY